MFYSWPILFLFSGFVYHCCAKTIAVAVPKTKKLYKSISYKNIEFLIWHKF
ncbi:hypothetical Protein YC6258_05213 [Gynuella sunshinyii YC6258]|uniref:Uncharacterized protein n=1 Tax=Gynuella sunshinyii YC6258 TaxID=1445510 RepID=A0A0C5VVE9_9GAMM|nr:hypothetical Protein YC6258_05213 [Gynuella sunshinyii YC6258]